MKQVNPGPYVLDFPTLGVRLLPGDEIDHPEPLAQCEPVEPDKSQSEKSDKGKVVASSDGKEVL